jgi:4-hydroxyphenylpyruvate dioxygenase
MKADGVGIRRLMGVHQYVKDLERTRRFYVDLLKFSEIGRSSAELERSGRQRSLVFKAGEVVITCSTPVGTGGRAARYLAHHPDGVGAIAFEVDDVRRTFAVLEERGGTPTSDIVTARDDGGVIETFSIATPFGDTTFRFVERRGHRGLFPGMETYDIPGGGKNELGFTEIDHITTNFETMKPALLWMEHVLGLEALWEVDFHTREVNGGGAGGSGLRSKVMWDPRAGIKFANNEPRRPSFKNSQVHQFHEDNRGDGVQHIALATRDIVHAVRGLRAGGVAFQSTPEAYYQLLPERLKRMGIDRIEEDLALLQELEILVDGSGPDRYLLQIFLRDSASLLGTRDAGPFFFETIERKGDPGFGAGNFRALFESIERQQALQKSA